MSFSDNLAKILNKHEELSKKLATGIVGDDFIKASKEYAELEPIVQTINEYNKSVSELHDIKEMAQEENLDNDTQTMIYDEVHRLEVLMPKLERAVKLSLLPKDEDDTKNAIIEVRAGSGGEEAALFAADLFNIFYNNNFGYTYYLVT